MVDTEYSPRTVAVVVADMIFASRIRAAADQTGVNVVFVRNAGQLASAAAPAVGVILDLDTRWLDAPAAIRELKHGPGSARPITCFVSHVRTDLIEAARDAGADRVLARSAFVRLLPEILAGR